MDFFKEKYENTSGIGKFWEDIGDISYGHTKSELENHLILSG